MDHRAEAWLQERRFERSCLALKRAKRRTRLTLALWCAGIFAFAMLCAWGGGLL